MALDLGFGRPVPKEVPLVVNHGWEGGSHAGLDIGIPVGTPLYAVDDGVVLRAVPTNSSDAGMFVDLQAASGVVARYLHMSQVIVATGQPVERGQLLGYSGNTGLSSGPHLHFETRAPASMHAAIAEATGVSRIADNLRGFEPPAVPSEPWLPVDDYRPGAISNARSQGIPLYNEIPHNAKAQSWATVIVASTLAVVGYVLYRRHSIRPGR